MRPILLAALVQNLGRQPHHQKCLGSSICHAYSENTKALRIRTLKNLSPTVHGREPLPLATRSSPQNRKLIFQESSGCYQIFHLRRLCNCWRSKGDPKNHPRSSKEGWYMRRVKKGPPCLSHCNETRKWYTSRYTTTQVHGWTFHNSQMTAELKRP